MLTAQKTVLGRTLFSHPNCQACQTYIFSRVSSAGIPCGSYHAGKKPGEKATILEDWTIGKLPVIVGTISLGMGIDKAGDLFLDFALQFRLNSFTGQSWRQYVASSNLFLYFGIFQILSKEHL